MRGVGIYNVQIFKCEQRGELSHRSIDVHTYGKENIKKKKLQKQQNHVEKWVRV